MKKTKIIFKTMIMIFIITLFTYIIMAVITDFSLNYKLQNYKFSQSLTLIFDFSSDFFQFFLWFIVLNIIWISAAIFIWFIFKIIKR